MSLGYEPYDVRPPVSDSLRSSRWPRQTCGMKSSQAFCVSPVSACAAASRAQNACTNQPSRRPVRVGQHDRRSGAQQAWEHLIRSRHTVQNHPLRSTAMAAVGAERWPRIIVRSEFHTIVKVISDGHGPRVRPGRQVPARSPLRRKYRQRCLATPVSVSLGDRRRGSAREQCYLPGCNRVTFSGLPSTLAAAASTASAKPGTDSLSRARNSWTARSIISWKFRASVKPIARWSCRRGAAVARYPVGSAGSARGVRPRRRGASSGTPPPFPPVNG